MANERRPGREIRLTMTARNARLALGAFRAARRKYQKDFERSKARGFVPAPGRFDANLHRIEVMDDFVAQLEHQTTKADGGFR